MSSGQSVFQDFSKPYDASPELYQKAFYESSTPMLLFSTGRKIVDANPALLSATAIPRQMLLNMPFDTLFPKVSDDYPRLFQGRVSHTSPLFTFSTHMARHGRETIPVDIAVAPVPLFDPRNGPLIFQAHITPRQRRTDADRSGDIQDRLNSIGALAGGIAHNFNNILTGIYGHIILAKLELPRDTDAVRHLNRAEDSMEEAVKLTRQLLTFAPGGDPVMETFAPALVMEELVRFNLSGASVSLKMSADDDLWPVHADKNQIGQVVANIVRNARQAMPGGGSLEVCLKNTSEIKENLLTIASGNFLMVTFSDSGCGIAQRDIQRIFDPYFTTRPDGNGMGLSICHSIITKHKGYIFACSQPGIGTCITIYLPAKPQTPAKEEIMCSTADRSSHHPARILVMDDEEHIRTITRKMIEKFGYEVTLTEDGESAITEYGKALEEKRPFGLVIMDLTIPGGMGGQEASRHILDMDPDAHIVVSSGYSNDQIMSDYKSYGLKGIIPKPFRLAELKSVLDNLVR